MNHSTQVFRGLIAYPITPLTLPEGLVNHDVLGRLVTGVAAAGVDGVTVLASSGGGISFDRDERRQIVETAVAATAAASAEPISNTVAIPVYVAVTAPTTRDVIAFARDAADLGASGLVIAPFSYAPLDDDEVIALVKELSDATPLPICFYNKPRETQYDLPPTVLTLLLAETNLMALKEPAPRPGRPVSRLVNLRSAGGTELSLGLSGDTQLLTDLPAVDAWHTGLAALKPAQYARVWRSSQTEASASNSADLADDRTLLLALATALHSSSRSLGALHALASLCGFETDAPRGPQLPAHPSDLPALHHALESA
ncbi:dihydrodipicolinate synthase family protein [Cryobacterium sp. CG_9.6]|uniref:dihydrodipicolinate synthase family protein n=1 Tax=Cryobacterium sp. CG_9.6 TaxID=2760710 RepID=UPI00247302DF|nr:dihydrodipicolinate synthase family protein [Cryobacterium sp. CG_9.6]MDH6235568.1 4-hydroxy-tetrahydrodipicolinate synthase [Cryobacterium sp. CG_9.6]